MTTASRPNELVQRLLAQQAGKCFICQKDIDPVSDTIEVDHILPRVIEDSELFEQKFPEELWGLLSKLVHSLANLPVWVNKQLSGTIFGGKQDHEYWKIIFESGRARGGVAVLAKPLNLKDLIS